MCESEEDHNRLHEQPKSTRILINSSREQTQDRFHEVGYKINKNYKWNPNSSKEILISDDCTNVLNFERPKTSQMATRSQLIGKDDLSKSTNSKTPTIALEVERNKTPNNENTSKAMQANEKSRNLTPFGLRGKTSIKTDNYTLNDISLPICPNSYK